ncbi:uncharacterized protein Z520_01747 [Fonsecaea multimorphosa CBS 102226]|uniref:ATP-grasp domain-containing protein n=1 Tax=Fonsecaea multimorphosa CBS 102226 TaxID=1442371 RepID=A0A0D2KIH1_9EURO|nr:uncharacterized protein Z520_01747 [Fonsecaea multimorphosa CBS 102226]KIY03280.1 hypothetical protein Z520_01747 [Fonsecaea multimorphosa CBS 102226]OAL30199.1 hypothetical protein AYO22_01715 [Fonsecaea multimorphosa]
MVHSPSTALRVAVLYQACDPPEVNGVRKPKKPGGYQDSGADIAYVLASRKDVHVIVAERNPDPKRDGGWCYPDTEAGILSAIERGANILWANTILFASHPLQTSSALDKYAAEMKVVGQPPRFVQQYDDKNYVNNLLRKHGGFTVPRSWTLDSTSSLSLETLPYPIVAKPIRGRGSHGVKVCRNSSDLSAHLSVLFKESPIAMAEEYLSGQEATITVMPPSEDREGYYALPLVVRFNHQDGIAPYNGVVAVTANSKALTPHEAAANPRYQEISKECEEVARLLRVTAPIRIDVRQLTEATDSQFAIFDVNMKPNMTGPGRPGREDQASLTAMAASALGWDYPELLVKMLKSARTLQDLRQMDV